MKEQRQSGDNKLLDKLVKSIDVKSLIQERETAQANQAELVNSVNQIFTDPVSIPKTQVYGQGASIGAYAQTTFQQHTTTQPLAAEIEFSDQSIDALKKEISGIKKDIKDSQKILVQSLLAKAQNQQLDAEFEPPTLDTYNIDEQQETPAQAVTGSTVSQNAGLELLSRAASGLRAVVGKAYDYGTASYRAKEATKKISSTPKECFENIKTIIGDLNSGEKVTRSNLSALESNLKQLNQIVNATGIMCNRAKSPEQKLKASDALQEESKYLDKALDMVRANSVALTKASSILKHSFNTEQLVKSLEATLESVSKFMQSLKSTLSLKTTSMRM
ncbi:hypothetical protein ABXZ88_003959 [Vibrio fluvialis]